MRLISSRKAIFQAELSSVRTLQSLPFLLLIGFFFFHWWTVYRWAVDVPFWDEWENIPNAPFLQWLFAPNNEHRIVTTKLVTLILVWLAGGSYIVQQVFNFALFGLVLIALGCLLRKAVSSLPAWVIALLLLYCLSPMNHENHSWGFQMQWHFTLLFLCGSAYFWFSSDTDPQRGSRLALGTLSGLLCAYSLSGGMVAILAVVLLFGAFKFSRGQARREHRRLELQQLFLATFPIVVAVGHHVLTLARISPAIPRTSIAKPAFWEHFSIMLGTSTGAVLAPPIAQLLGLLTGLFVIGPWIILWWRRRSGGAVPANLWCIAAMTVGLLAALITISMGRASLGGGQAFSSRYREFSMILVPLAFAAWWCALEIRPRVRLGFMVLPLAIYGFFFVQSFRYFYFYERNYHLRTASIQYLRLCYFSNENACLIPPLFADPIRKESLYRAESLNYSFMRQIR